MSFFPGYDYDDFGSGWPWGFASGPRGGGYSYVDPFERRRAYYPGRESFHLPSQNYGRRVPHHARGPAYEHEVPISDPISDRAQAPAAHLKKHNASHVKKQAAQKSSPQVTRVVPISEPASSKAPVCRFVTKEDAAIKIQSVFRGYSVRHTRPLWSLRKIAETKGKLVVFKNQVSDPERMRLVRENMKERVVLTEGVMNLLLQLDSIQGALPIVREIRKATVREIVQLQERIDSILQQKELNSELESSEGANGEMEVEKPELESSEGANGEMEVEKPELESSEGANGEMELGEQELEESNKQMESSHEGGDESMDISACDNAQEAATIIKDEEGLNIVGDTGADNVEATQDTGADNVEAALGTGSERDAAMMGDDHEAAQKTGDNLEAAQVNIVEADQMAEAQDSEKDAAMMGDSEQLDQNVLKTHALSLEETDAEKAKQGMLELQDGVEGEVRGECRRIVDAMVDEAVHKAEAAEVCASRKREREENEEQEASDADNKASTGEGKAGPDEYMKIMVKLVDENAQLKKLVTGCLKQTELQNALICHLNDRVQKLERKAKNKKKNAKQTDLF